MNSQKNETEKDKFTCFFKINRRAKRIRLRIYGDGSVTISLPDVGHMVQAREFVRKKEAWIKKKLLEMRHQSLLFEMEKRRFSISRLEAKKEIKKRVDKYCAFYKVNCEKIIIRDQKTRWGSCSREGALSFNRVVALLPEEFLNYIVVHEVCHLREFNHSEKFWRLVAISIPDFQKMKKRMS